MSKPKHARVLQFPSPFSEEASEGKDNQAGKVIIEVHHYYHPYPSRQAQPRLVQTARRRGFWDRIGRWWTSMPPAQRTAIIIVLAAFITLCG
ncbi:MAG TPA: hypothetical protein ENJ72_03995 [Thermodesulfatator sp.]|nr:hypothetical protein [Thermodesulfatator sp.]